MAAQSEPIGLGSMGRPMATSLVRKGFAVLHALAEFKKLAPLRQIEAVSSNWLTF